MAPTLLGNALVRAAAASAVLAAACAHAPAGQQASAPAQAGARPERQERVLVTGSRIPRPVGRDGLPITDYPIRIHTIRELERQGSGDVARMLRTTDVNVQ